MPVFKSNEVLPAQPIIALFFGEAGVSKTSLASTAKNPINIDFDRGIKRSFGKCDALVLTDGWKEVLAELSAGTFNSYDTIIIDTAKGALDDFLMVYVTEQDYKLKTNQLKMFGKIGDEFKLFTNQLRAMGKDIIIIAHAKDKEDGDAVKKIPDVTGQSSQLLIRIADQVGYLSIRNGQRVISFSPTDTIIGKNTAQLPPLTLPPTGDPAWNGFCDREIIQKVKEHLASMSEEQVAALKYIEEWRSAIDGYLPGEGIDIDGVWRQVGDAIAKIEPEHIKKQIRAYMMKHIDSCGYAWNKNAKAFTLKEAPAPAAIPTPAPATPATAPAPAPAATPVKGNTVEQAPNAVNGAQQQAVAPPATPAPAPVQEEEAAPVIAPQPDMAAEMVAEAEQQRAEIAKQQAAAPVITKNPYLPPPSNDLFARRD